MNEIVFDRLLDFRHVAGYALAPSTIFRMVGMIGDSPFQPCGIVLGMAGKTNLVALFNQARRVPIAMYIVTIRAPNFAVVHVALDKVVSLHPVLMRRHVGILIKVRRTGFEVFKLPEVGQTLARQIAHRPIVIFARNWAAERSSLAVALNADVVAPHIIQLAGIYDILFGRVFDVFAARSMALFAAHIPLSHLLRLDVVIHRMATVAGWAGWPVEIRRSIKRNPPIGAGFCVVRKPPAFLDVPLCRKWIIIVSTLGKVALFPAASIDERHLIQTESDNRIGMREISKHSLGMLLGIADHIRHPCLLPALVRFSMAFLTTLRSYKMGWS